MSGRLYDLAVDLWLETGHYASRPPGELHGPFKTDVGCVVLELSFPNRANTGTSKRQVVYGHRMHGEDGFFHIGSGDREARANVDRSQAQLGSSSSMRRAASGE